ncbi:YdcF family protein [Erythrobacter sp. SCSIO 43205]|uniref:YdcF family protein n=1 Tax=Erythrobacter sp. SCSIO 43205 TaxID=2779361 RepID=UPI001CA7F98F|nr:YdcF family protein [Erythrobacter sp. SCSIO 43205]UAB78765.1 YdcF family protein [Erythrobacter sp. SCSIO 43205]
MKTFRYLASFVLLVWALGFLWFAAALPQPAGAERTDAVIVATGGAGRIPQGLAVLDAGLAQKMLVTGVDREVTPGEFAAEFEVSEARMECCVSLGFQAVDTRGNAAEAAEWVMENEIGSVRLVTTDWHMRRAGYELAQKLPDDMTLVRDAVPSTPSLASLFLEYHKLIASYGAGLFGY